MRWYMMVVVMAGLGYVHNQAICPPGSTMTSSVQTGYFLDHVTSRIVMFNPANNAFTSLCQYTGTDVCRVSFKPTSTDCSKDGRYYYVVGPDTNFARVDLTDMTIAYTSHPTPVLKVRTWWDSTILFLYTNDYKWWIYRVDDQSYALLHAMAVNTLFTDVILLPDMANVLLSDKSVMYRINIATLAATRLTFQTMIGNSWEKCSVNNNDAEVGFIGPMVLASSGQVAYFYANGCNMFYKFDLTTNKMSLFSGAFTTIYPDGLYIADDMSRLLITQIFYDGTEYGGITAIGLPSALFTELSYGFGARGRAKGLAMNSVPSCQGTTSLTTPTPIPSTTSRPRATTSTSSAATTTTIPPSTTAAAPVCPAESYPATATNLVVVADQKSGWFSFMLYNPSTRTASVISPNTNRPCYISGVNDPAATTRDGSTIYFVGNEYINQLDTASLVCTQMSLPVYAHFPVLSHNEDGLFYYNPWSTAWFKYVFATGESTFICSSEGGVQEKKIGVYPDGSGILLPNSGGPYKVSLADLSMQRVFGGGASAACTGGLGTETSITDTNVIVFAKLSSLVYIYGGVCKQIYSFNTATTQVTVIAPITTAWYTNIRMVLSADETFLILSESIAVINTIYHIDVVTGARTPYTYTLADNTLGTPIVQSAVTILSNCQPCSTPGNHAPYCVPPPTTTLAPTTSTLAPTTTPAVCPAGYYATAADEKVVLVNVRSNGLSLMQYTPGTQAMAEITPDSSHPCGVSSSYYSYIRSGALTRDGRTLYFDIGLYVYAVDVVYKNCTKTALPAYATTPVLTYDEDGLFFYNTIANAGLVVAWYKYTFSTGALLRICASQGSAVYPIGVFPDGSGILVPGDYALFKVSLSDLSMAKISGGGLALACGSGRGLEASLGSADLIAFSRYTPVAYILDIYCSNLCRFDTQTQQLTIIASMKDVVLSTNMKMVLSADETFLIASIPYMSFMVYHIDVITGARTEYPFTTSNGQSLQPTILAGQGRTSGCEVCRYFCPNPRLGQTYCPSGYTCPNSTSAVVCAAGFFCPYNSIAPTVCPPGYQCPVSGGSAAALCLSGYLCPLGTIFAALCPGGSYCATTTSVSECPIGTACPSGSTQPIVCPPGKLCPLHATAMVPCASGFHCPNATVQLVCPPAFYCPAGSSGPTPCPISSYCPASGASAAPPCAPGYVCPVTTLQLPCPPAFYCAAGSSAATACPITSYCNASGASVAPQCAAGFFCPNVTLQLECPPAFYCAVGSANATVCPDNYYCPAGGMSAPLPCLPSKYCPPGSTWQEAERPTTTPAPTTTSNTPAPRTTSPLSTYAPCKPGSFLRPVGPVTAYMHDVLYNGIYYVDLNTMIGTRFCTIMVSPTDATENQISRDGRYMYMVDGINFFRLDLTTGGKETFLYNKWYLRMGLFLDETAAFVYSQMTWLKYNFSDASLAPVYTTRDYLATDIVFLPDGFHLLIADRTEVLQINMDTMASVLVANVGSTIVRMIMSNSRSFLIVADATCLYRLDLPWFAVTTLQYTAHTVRSITISTNDDSVYMIQETYPLNRLSIFDLQTMQETVLIYTQNRFLGNPKELAIYVKRECAPCELGYYCDGSSRLLCPPGLYCASPVSMEDCWLGFYCPAGSYNMTLCPAGSWCPNPSVKHICPKGSYCAAGSLGATPCSLGSYCGEGSGFDTPCPAGSVCPDPMTQSACPLGYFCAAGLSEPTPCVLGAYCDVGSSAENLCPTGHLCITPSNISLCPLGHYCGEGYAIPFLCSPGSYCGEGSSEETPCPQGAFCVNSSSLTQCPIGSFCTAGSTAARPCAPGTYCLPGSSTQTPCAERFVCTSASTQVHCAYGQNCPAGTSQALSCPPVGGSCTNPMPQSPCTPGTYGSKSGRMYYFTDLLTMTIGTFDPKDDYIAPACRYDGTSVCRTTFSPYSTDCSKDGRFLYMMGDAWFTRASAKVDLKTMVATPIAIPNTGRQVRTWWNNSVLFVFKDSTWYLYDGNLVPTLMYTTGAFSSDLVLLPDRQHVLVADKGVFMKIHVDTLNATPAMVGSTPDIQSYYYCRFTNEARSIGEIYRMAMANAGTHVILYSMQCRAFYSYNLTTDRISFLYQDAKSGEWEPDAMHLAPDDSYMLYTRFDNSRKGGIFRMNLTTFVITELTYQFGLFNRYGNVNPDLPVDPVPPAAFAQAISMSPQMVCLPCLRGEYCTGEYRALCRLGSFCVNTWTQEDCPLGTFCPEGSVNATACPAGSFCSTPSNMTACILREYCPAGSTQAVICQAGYVCPNPWTQLICPAGNRCPAGSVNATKCASGSYCAAGSSAEVICSAGFVCSTPSEMVVCLSWQVCPAGCTRALQTTTTTPEPTTTTSLEPTTSTPPPTTTLAPTTTSAATTTPPPSNTTEPASNTPIIIGAAAGGVVAVSGLVLWNGGFTLLKSFLFKPSLVSRFEEENLLEHVRIKI